jgi:hypothetical protein
MQTGEMSRVHMLSQAIEVNRSQMRRKEGLRRCDERTVERRASSEYCVGLMAEAWGSFLVFFIFMVELRNFPDDGTASCSGIRTGVPTETDFRIDIE